MTPSPAPQAYLLNPFLHPDVVVKLDGGQFLTPDSVTVATEYEVRGGAGAYTAAALLRFGLSVSPVDHVGSDLFGDLTVAQVAALGCRLDQITRYDGPHFFVTSIADQQHLGGTMLSCCPPAWQQRADVMQGAIDALPDAEVGYVYSWFWSYPNPNVAEMDVTGLFGRLRHRVGLLAIDPNWKPQGDPPPSELAALKEVVSSVDVLKLNRRDAALLVPARRSPQIVRELLDLGPAVVVLTDGANGCVVGQAGRTKQVLIPAVPGPIRDTTGAGDIFGGALIGHYLRSGDPVEAATEAAAVTALHLAGAAVTDISNAACAQLGDRLRMESEVA